MRGRMAAACAALLVGLSPAGALPFASFAAAVSAQGSGDTIRNSCHSRRAATSVGTELRMVSPDPAPVVALGRAACAGKRAIWRSPSGPAPSRGPPAA